MIVKLWANDFEVGVEVHEMDTELVLQSIQWLKERQEA